MKLYLEEIVREAGSIALNFFREGVEASIKSDVGDLLTIADETVNRHIIDRILSRYPDHAIHSEELSEDINPGATYEWVIDPIDGTRNFANAHLPWCVLVAVLRDGEPYLGCVYSPLDNALYIAEKGSGSSLNGVPIQVNQVHSFHRALGHIVCDKSGVAFPQHLSFTANFLERGGMLQCLNTMIAACYVARGGVDFFVSNCGHFHDLVAPSLICREAGALVTTFSGREWGRGDKEIVMANPAMHPRLLELFSEGQ